MKIFSDSKDGKPFKLLDLFSASLRSNRYFEGDFLLNTNIIALIVSWRLS